MKDRGDDCRRAALAAAAAAARRVPAEAGAVAAARWLRARYPPEVARRAGQLREAHRRAAGKLDDAERLVATRETLEKATRSAVARERARRIALLVPGAAVLDATAGLGGDAIELARAGLFTVAADRDPLAAALAAENLAALGFPPRVLVMNALRPAVRTRLLVLDPDRRAGGARSLDPRAWSPPLARALELATGFEGACLKLAPALDPDAVHLPPGAPHRWSWVSFAGELMETTLWMGLLAPEHATDPRGRDAVVLSARGARRVRGHPIRVPALAPSEARAVRWLLEPDPAVIRSGLVGWVARAAGARPLAPDIAFLGASAKPAAGPYRIWRVLGTAPADPRRVRELLRAHDVGPVAVKRRGHPVPVPELERRFRGRGSKPGTLAVTRLARGHLALLLEPTPGGVGDEGLEPPTSSL